MQKQTLINILHNIDEFIEFYNIPYNNDVITLRHSIIMQYVNDNDLSLDYYDKLCIEL